MRRLTYLRIVFSALALALIVFGLFTMRERSRSRGWQSVNGKVVATSVSEYKSRDGAHTYRPMVIFGYTVGGARYMSNRISFRQLSSANKSDAQYYLNKYREGQGVQVFYDPTEPDRAVLDRGRDPWAFIIGGGVCSLLAVVMRILQARTEKHGTA